MELSSSQGEIAQMRKSQARTCLGRHLSSFHRTLLRSSLRVPDSLLAVFTRPRQRYFQRIDEPKLASATEANETPQCLLRSQWSWKELLVPSQFLKGGTTRLRQEQGVRLPSDRLSSSIDNYGRSRSLQGFPSFSQTSAGAIMYS